MKNKDRHIVIGTDANYLPRAIVFYKSLSKFHKNFTLHIFCFDDITFEVFKTLKYPNVVYYHPNEYENKKLLQIKNSKDKRYEYYWALNPSMGWKVINEIKDEVIALADCDMMFFDSPEAIFDELGNDDVIIQPNNFSFQYEKDFIPVGYYCTSFQCFRNNLNGKKILNWWRNQCLKWCSSNFERGQFGDQKYLDDWRIRFKKVRESENPGTNVAPWNVQKFHISNKNNKIYINGKWPLIYYHFHSFRMNLDDYKYIITGDRENNYQISKDVERIIYQPYIRQMIKAIKDLKRIPIYKEYTKTNPKGIQISFDGQKISKYAHSPNP